MTENGGRHTLVVADEQCMLQLGASLAQPPAGGLRLYFEGELAAGKTVCARGFLRARGYHGTVKSPTFTLVESYALATGTVHHFDLYRLRDPEELYFLGVDDYLVNSADCLVEWPSRARRALPPADLNLHIECLDSRRRRVEMVVSSAKGAALLRHLKNDGWGPSTAIDSH